MENSKVGIGETKNLYEYWGDLLYRSVIDNSRIIINLASKEYSKCIEKYLTRQDRYITITFCELSGDKLVTKGTYAKMARGEMVRFMAVQNHCFRKIGFVKYNAFDNIGNNLSFAFTVLDGKNDGFCLSSVYGRNESRIFAKPIVEGKCLYGMSEEERESLDNALNYSGDMQAVQKDLEG